MHIIIDQVFTTDGMESATIISALDICCVCGKEKVVIAFIPDEGVDEPFFFCKKCMNVIFTTAHEEAMVLLHQLTEKQTGKRSDSHEKDTDFVDGVDCFVAGNAELPGIL